MSATVFITGFRRNTADPVVLECRKATNGFGDHPFAGDRLKTVRIFPCGATAQTYDWPVEGYAWGIMISAPAVDDHAQPGRPRDICIGTNPVQITVSQKGAGEATVTIAPQLVLKQGLVGGGGTYEASNCNGDQRGAGGGGAGGGAGPFRCGLGSTWTESESGWTGTWTRRGTSNTFDAHWERSGFKAIDQILTMTINGNVVEITRQDPNVPGNMCFYEGEIARDGISVSGEYTCNDRGNQIGPVAWTATIMCAAQPGGSTLMGRFALQTASGNYLTAVNGGGIQGPGAINSDATKVSGWETFEVEPQPDGKYAIKTMNGNYLTAMRGGGVTGADVIHSDGRRIDAWEKFTLKPQSDGTYAIQTANGNYLSAVNGGGIGGGRGAIHTDATTVRGWEKFKLVAAGTSEESVVYDSSSLKGSAYQWVSTGVGDCSGQDIGQSSGSGQPDSSECKAGTVGTVAICWDGRTYSNGGSRSWCTYKNTNGRPCRGGGNPGFAFQCQAR